MTQPTTDLAGAFRRYNDLCRADSVCAQGYPDLPGRWKDQAGRLNANPVLLQAAVPDDENAPPIPVLIDGARGADALRDALGDSGTYPVIPSVLYEIVPDVVVGDTLLDHDSSRWDESAPWGALLSFQCSYEVHTRIPNADALAARTYPEFVGADDSQWPSWCETWNVPDRSHALSIDIASPVPALVFRGDLSPEGSSDWTRTVLRGFSNGHAAIFPTLGDDLLTTGPPCLSDLRRKFLTDPTAPLDTAPCVAQSPPIHFTAPG